VNKEQWASNLTLNYDNATNDILALDRGKAIQASESDDNEYLLSRISHRMKQSDFDMLPAQVQGNYQALKQGHEEMMKQKRQDAEAAKAGWIPTGGPLIGVDCWIPRGSDPSKAMRARLPQEAINWLVERLEKQGTRQAQLNALPPEVALDLTRQGYNSDLALPPMEGGGAEAVGANQLLPQ
jgi:hypothetical protein